MKIKAFLFIVVITSLLFCNKVNAGEKKTDYIIFNDSFTMKNLENGTNIKSCSPLRFTEEEENLLARIMMSEAESESDIGKLYVLHVVLNRVKSNDFPDTIKEVIFQKTGSVYQFSPVEDGRIWKVDPDNVCYEILADVQSEYYDCTDGALYFCEKNSDRWHREKEYLFTYGNHNFYR